MKVSICLITYNSSKYVRDTLESIMAQTYENIELIISDDCSTDNTFDICKEYLIRLRQRFKTVKLVKTDKNIGIVGNYNFALSYITGDWVKYIAGDDILTKDCIEIFVKNIDCNSKIMTCGRREFSENSSLNKIVYEKTLWKRKQLKEIMKVCPTHILCGATLFIKTSLLKEYKGFDISFPMIEDYTICMRYLLDNGYIKQIPKVLVNYRVYEQSVSNSKNKQYILSINRIIKWYMFKGLYKEKMFLWMYHYYLDYVLTLDNKNVLRCILSCFDLIRIKKYINRKYNKIIKSYRVQDIRYLLLKKIFLKIKGLLYSNGISVYYVRWTKNFGDELGVYILKKYGFTPYFEYPSKARIVVVGTIIELLGNTFSGYVVGAGWSRYKNAEYKNAKFVAVRGDLTRQMLGLDKNIVLGDPGLLMSKLLKINNSRQFKIGIIPHESEVDDMSVLSFVMRYNKQVKMIKPNRADFKDVIYDINSCENIISSSLHGLIVADSYGIPNIHIKIKDIDNTSDFKFNDYYSSINKEHIMINFTGDEDLDYLISKCRVPDMEIVKQKQKELDYLFSNLKDIL